jgi:hypothetical protein
MSVKVSFLRKKNIIPLIALFAAMCLFAVANDSSPQEPEQKSDVTNASQTNRVKILLPMDYQAVGFRTIVKGTAQILDDSEIWVLVHPKFMTDQWWPQPKPIIDGKGNWEAMVYLGVPQDIGYDFEIAVATFSKQEAAKIQEYHSHGMKLGSWLPIAFPKASSNIDKIIVKKTEHY